MHSLIILIMKYSDKTQPRLSCLKGNPFTAKELKSSEQQERGHRQHRDSKIHISALWFTTKSEGMGGCRTI